MTDTDRSAFIVRLAARLLRAGRAPSWSAALELARRLAGG